jgi:hypothetical protein
MFDPTAWEAWLKAEWAVIWHAPFSFVSVVIVGWLLGWVVIRAWYRRSIRIADDRTKLVETERDIERRQKEGLREAIKESKPDAPVLAIEVAHGDPEMRNFIEALARGARVTTPVNPTVDQVHLVVKGPLTSEEIKNIANLSYTSANGLSQVFKVVGATTVSSGTAVTTNILKWNG